jgi:GH24 family phage-related lysozyme (muramidase)
MSAKQQGALISFAFNLGPNFYAAKGFETISKRLREKDWKAVPAAFALYRNPGTSAEAGLLRRRKAEGALWAEGMVKQPVQQQLPYKVKPATPLARGYRPT